MDNLKERIEDKLSQYTPVGEALCQGSCETEVIRDKTGIVIVCNWCKRTVIDNRD
jgi:hypothetical protein